MWNSRTRRACVIALVGALGTSSAWAVAPGPVGDTVRMSHDKGTGITTISWDPIADATYYNTYRGEIPQAGMGSRGAQGYEIVTSSGVGGQFAPCPGTKRVIGGGAEGVSHIWSSRPEPPGTGWYASGGGPFVVSYAICADVGTSYQIVSVSGGGGQFATCPADKKLIGGGAEGNAPLYSSRPEPPGTGWYGSAGGPFVVSYAICANADDTYEIVSVSGGGIQSAPCPGMKLVSGGGVETTSLFYGSRPEAAGNGWNANGGGAFIVDYAICIAGPFAHACHEAGDAAGDGATVSTLNATPPQRTGFYVLVSGGNASGEGPLGAGVARDGSAIPRWTPTPCPTPP